MQYRKQFNLPWRSLVPHYHPRSSYSQKISIFTFLSFFFPCFFFFFFFSSRPNPFSFPSSLLRRIFAPLLTIIHYLSQLPRNTLPRMSSSFLQANQPRTLFTFLPDVSPTFLTFICLPFSELTSYSNTFPQYFR
jgi:hypothetical protein